MVYLRGEISIIHYLSPEERAQDLLSRLTLEQKAQLMQDISEAIPELGSSSRQEDLQELKFSID